MRLIKMQYLQTVPARITRPLPRPVPVFIPPLPPPLSALILLEWTARSIFTSASVVPTANGEIMIKPTSFQWNDGNYRVSAVPGYRCSCIIQKRRISISPRRRRRRKVRSRRPNRIRFFLPAPRRTTRNRPRCQFSKRKRRQRVPLISRAFAHVCIFIVRVVGNAFATYGIIIQNRILYARRVIIAYSNVSINIARSKP